LHRKVLHTAHFDHAHNSASSLLCRDVWSGRGELWLNLICVPVFSYSGLTRRPRNCASVHPKHREGPCSNCTTRPPHACTAVHPAHPRGHELARGSSTTTTRTTSTTSARETPERPEESRRPPGHDGQNASPCTGETQTFQGSSEAKASGRADRAYILGPGCNMCAALVPGCQHQPILSVWGTKRV